MLSKRSRILIASFLLAALVYLSSKFTQERYGEWGVVLFLAATTLTYWVTGFGLKSWEFIIIPLYPILTGYTFCLLVQGWARGGYINFLAEGAELWVISIGAGVFFYILYLTLNILNVATVRTVPLKKAAQTIFPLLGWVSGLVTFYFLNQGLLFQGWLQQILLSGVLASAYALPVLWFVQEQNFRLPWPEVLVAGLVTTQALVVSSFYPSDSLVRSFVASVVLFGMVDLLSRKIRRELSTENFWEYLLIVVFLWGLFLLRGGQ